MKGKIIDILTSATAVIFVIAVVLISLGIAAALVGLTVLGALNVWIGVVEVWKMM
jgi:hypothetical protein